MVTMAEDRVFIAWEFKGDAKRKSKAHYRLFGHKVKRQGKTYYYDGVLQGFKDGRKVPLISYEHYGRAHISVPASEAERIIEILTEAKADNISIGYNTRRNLYVKRF